MALAEPPASPRTPDPHPTHAATDIAALTEALRAAPVTFVIPRPVALVHKLGSELDRHARSMPQLVPSFRKAARACQRLAGIDVFSNLASSGLDPERPAIVFADPAKRSVVVSFAVSDRAEFEARLHQLAGKEQRLIAVGRETATVLFSDSELPIACLTRARVAWCQLGSEPTDEPFAQLRAASRARGRDRRAVQSFQFAASQLSASADFYVLLDPASIAAFFRQEYLAHKRRGHRFDTRAARRFHEADASALASRFAHYADAWLGGVAAFFVDGDGLRGELSLAIDEGGARALRSVLNPTAAPDAVTAWANSPALARLIVRMSPVLVSEWLRTVGVAVPAHALSGTVAALALGVDTEAPAAKSGAPRELGVLPFVIPMAAAVSLVSPLEAPGLDRRELYGSPFELRARRDALLIGTGAGSGAAAERRWQHRAPSRAPQAVEPFIDLTVDIRAVSAAIGAGAFDDTRAELRVAEGVYRRFAPVVRLYRAVEFRGWSEEQGRRLRFDLLIRR